jgi:hypothetical protein
MITKPKKRRDQGFYMYYNISKWLPSGSSASVHLPKQGSPIFGTTILPPKDTTFLLYSSTDSTEMWFVGLAISCIGDPFCHKAHPRANGVHCFFIDGNSYHKIVDGWSKLLLHRPTKKIHIKFLDPFNIIG